MNRRVSIASLIHEIHERAPAGFAVALHLRFTSARFTIQTYPVAWTEEYSRRGFVLQDPVVKWAFSNAGAIRWRDLSDLDSHGVMQRACKHGLRYGASIAHMANGARSMAGCARSDRDYLDVEIAELQHLVGRLHDGTGDLAEMSQADVDTLRQMSVRMTRG